MSQPESAHSNEVDQPPEEASSSAGDDARPGKLSNRRRRIQFPLLLCALVGIAGAGSYVWTHRATYARLCGLPGGGPGPLGGQAVLPSEWDLSEAIIPVEEILHGGPPKDGIPSLSDPALIGRSEASFLDPDDRVAGVVLNGQARAYPLKILVYHEAANDRIAGLPIAVTYCPLCDSVAVFDRQTDGGELEFGISGWLYNSNVLLYDRSRQESLWSQMMAKGVAGPRVNQALKVLPVELTTWADWSSRYPETTVLSTETGHPRDYSAEPYANYFSMPDLMFPATPTDDRLPLKTPVLGIWTQKAARAYAITEFKDVDEPHQYRAELDGLKLTVGYNPTAKSLRVAEADEGLQWMYAYWFAWYAFRPNTELYEASAGNVAKGQSGKE